LIYFDACLVIYLSEGHPAGADRSPTLWQVPQTLIGRRRDDASSYISPLELEAPEVVSKQNETCRRQQ
jgi:hypothetical protein